jgi:tetratricopeptide (TPR) repeat protein
MSLDVFRISRLFLGFALVACLAMPRQAHAQPSFADSAERLIIAGHHALDERTEESVDRGIGFFQLALAEMGEAPEHRPRVAVVLVNLGNAHSSRKRPDSAFVYFDRAIGIFRQVGDRAGEGHALYNLGVTLTAQGRNDVALTHFHAALVIKRGLADRPGEAVVLGAIGNAHSALTHGDSASVYLRQALALAEVLGDTDVEAATLVYMASMHREVGRGDSAAFYHERAEEIYRSLEDPAGTLRLRVSQLSIPTRTDADSVLVGLYELLTAVRAGTDPQLESMVLDQIATAHERAGRPDSALAYHGQALLLHRRMGDQRGEGVTLSHMAGAHVALGHADSAVAYYHWALPLLRATGDRQEEGSVLLNLGIHHHKTGTRAALARAVAYYDSADAVLAAVGRAAGGDEGRLSVAELNVALFESWTLAWHLREGQMGRRRSAYAALAASERGRAQALRDLMRRHGDPVRDERAVPAHDGPGADMVAEGRALALAVGRSGVPALSFTVTDGTLLAFLVQPDGRVEVFRTIVTADSLAVLVAQVRSGLKVDSAASNLRGAGLPGAEADSSRPGEPGELIPWQRPASYLSGLLFPEALLDRLPASGELLIVPSGPLFLLPFAVLPLSMGERGDALLGLRYALRYAPSLQVITELEARQDTMNPAANALVVGNPVMPVTTPWKQALDLDDLHEAFLEGGWVADRLGTSLFTGPEATEAAVRERLGSASLVHLATHARAYTSAVPGESYIALAPGENEDGVLTVSEIMNEVPDMRAELVVLSACQTGLGPLNQAEGTVGFQRAFLARGARGVLVSQWSVDNNVTALLMQEFYANWLGGSSRAEALRKAQLTVAQDHPDPRLWAAFQMVGVH